MRINPPARPRSNSDRPLRFSSRRNRRVKERTDARTREERRRGERKNELSVRGILSGRKGGARRRAVAVMRAKMSVAAVDRRASERFRPRTSGEGARKPSARRSRRDERAGGERSCSGRFRPAQKQNCRLLLFLRPSSRPSGAVVRAKSAASKISLTPASLLLLRRRAPPRR